MNIFARKDIRRTVNSAYIACICTSTPAIVITFVMVLNLGQLYPPNGP